MTINNMYVNIINIIIYIYITIICFIQDIIIYIHFFIVIHSLQVISIEVELKKITPVFFSSVIIRYNEIKQLY